MYTTSKKITQLMFRNMMLQKSQTHFDKPTTGNAGHSTNTLQRFDVSSCR